MAVRDEIVLRSGIIYFIIALFAIAVLAMILVLQIVQHGKWSSMSEKYVYQTTEMPANRGDILAMDGRLLASSVPYYTIYMDTRSTGMSGTTWSNGIDGLSAGLERLLGERSAEGWKAVITQARKRGDRYFLIKRRVSYETLKQLKKLPIFREGQFKGGLVAQAENRRILPNSELAARTIGYLNLGAEGTEVGIEGSFDKDLAGRNGIVVKQRLTGGDWIDVDDASSVEARDGNDIITTIDIDLQDVASSALKNQLKKHNAHHGCAIVMEVATGDIRAIVNLEEGGDGDYHETYNYAIAESTEPGSTFKLPSLMAALEDGVIDTGDVVDTGTGSVKFYNKIIRDTKEEGYGKLTVSQVFGLSSNVGTSKLIYEHYKDNPRDFVNRLYAMKLNEKLNIQLKGEGEPLIRYPGDKLWSGLSLPMMSHGYEVQLTPLQILTFYNAVANDGRMMRPRFVTAVMRNGHVIRRFEPDVIINSIASRNTIRKAKKMMEGVVEKGTATNLKNANYKIAGKTGTAQIAKGRSGYRSGVRISYQASFVGYFPAENPLYSCIIVVNAPSNGVYYGNLVAGSVFREISDKIYATNFYRDYKNAENITRDQSAPEAGNGYRPDLNTVLRKLDVRHMKNTKSDWVATRESGDTVSFAGVNTIKGLVPDVRGMTLRDAVYLLENSGYRVKYSGKGKVRRQSPEHGARYFEGQIVSLEMNM
ncbi:MAG TPA: penicillin-binding protein [Bacteroidales bacterium]|jgi:cell division protein FtsI (penicillin-binding protein 3)|nr:PASTA domain-containing protein [Bacteroidales bacterium]OQB62772.1 MAG: Peptidoglycan synthase FtsI precursor [Bacteroidetes bacterium ADurb.Bin145]NMD03524.1 transpeptidase family protein [Bacteroidales bacterium]HOU01964.1 penicillin-binding protein [Bacteroidales bacterium]HQG62341.1 penicillin-binding protein [Bacteroidales bacterium]